MDVSEALRIAPDGRVVVRLSSPPVWAVLRGDGARAMYLDEQAQHWPAFAVNPFVSSGWARQCGEEARSRVRPTKQMRGDVIRLLFALADEDPALRARLAERLRAVEERRRDTEV